MLDKVHGTGDMQLLREAGRKDKLESANMGGNKAVAVGEVMGGKVGGRTGVEEELDGFKGRAKGREIALRVLAEEKEEVERKKRGQ